MRTLMSIVPFLSVALVSQACVVTIQKDSLHFPDAVDEVQLDLASGDVEVVVEDRGDVLVERTQRYTRHEPTLTADLIDGILVLEVECPAMSGTCGADHLVRLPRSALVSGFTGAGDARLEGLSSLVDLETGAGDVELVGLSGEVMLHTAAGDIDGTALRSPAFVVETNAGDVELSFVEAADLVFVDTAAGDVTITTPAGPYDVYTETAAGDVSLRGIQRDGESTHAIEVHTSAGDIDLVGR